MDRFSADAVRLPCGPRVVLFHAKTGRSAALSPETVAELERWTPGLPPPPDLRVVAARLDGLHLLAESAPPPLPRLVPAASRLALLFPADQPPRLWFPIPEHRTPGGHAYGALPLSAEELAIWRAINGARTVTDVAARLGLPQPRVLDFLARLTHPSVQVVELRDRPVARRDLALERLVAPDRPLSARAPHHYGRFGETTLETYHTDDVADAAAQFDDRETTVAHAFALPHPALGGQPYGARLYAALDARGLVPPDGTTLEIGPGTGELAERWLEARRAAGLGGAYLRLDQSPALLEAQARRAPGSQGLLGSATRLPFPDKSLDLILCNEVIADLSAAPWSPDDPVDPDTPPYEVALRVRRYGVEPLPGRALYNLGAWLLVEEIARALAPGGAAYLSEFGGPDEVPQETEQLDHPEVSVHFGHLVTIARALDLEATLLPLPELLGMDLSATWLARFSYEALRARLRAEGRRLEARAWTLETLKLPWPVEGLCTVPLREPGPGPLPTRFWALLLRR